MLNQVKVQLSYVSNTETSCKIVSYVTRSNDQNAIIYIKNDDVGPVISGAKDITINKGNESALFADVSSNDIALSKSFSTPNP